VHFKHAHSDFFNVLAALGVLGISAFMVVLVTPIVYFYKKALQKITNDKRLYAYFGLVVSVGYVLFGLTESMLDRNISVMFFLTSIALCFCQTNIQNICNLKRV
jgi:O-antigen ligase